MRTIWTGVGIFSILSTIILATLPDHSDAVKEAAPAVVRLDRRFDRIVPQNTVIEKLADGFTWVEGPVWHPTEGFLLFSDIPRNQIIRWKPDEGVGVYLEKSGYTGGSPFEGREPGSNGLTFDEQGRLVICQHGDRKVIRLEKDGTRTTLAERYQGKRLNSPNDAVFSESGDLYFTDPPFGLPKTFDDLAKELSFQGVYRLTKNGRLDLLTKEINAPNGIAFSPDEKKLYISDPIAAAWFEFDVNEDGTISNKRLLVDGSMLKQNGPGGPDGIKVDKKGNLFTAGPGGLYVISPDGTLLGLFDLHSPVGNCAWGEDGSTLFITANTAIYRIRLRQ